MLIFANERYVPNTVNMITLENDLGYYHVHRSLYDKAVILYDQYNRNPDAFRSIIMGAVQRPESVFFYENAPEPINILGYYLDMITGEKPLSDEDMDDTDRMTLCCGALHVMSMSLDFRQLVKVDVKLRASIRFSLSIKEEYQIQWERFFAETCKYSLAPPPYQGVPGQKRMAVVDEAYKVWNPTSAGVPEMQDDYEEDIEVGEDEMLFEDEEEDFSAIMAQMAAERGEEPEAKESSAPAPVVPEVVEETPTAQAKSGLDLVRGWS